MKLKGSVDKSWGYLQAHGELEVSPHVEGETGAYLRTEARDAVSQVMLRSLTSLRVALEGKGKGGRARHRQASRRRDPSEGEEEEQKDEVSKGVMSLDHENLSEGCIVLHTHKCDVCGEDFQHAHRISRPELLNSFAFPTPVSGAVCDPCEP